MINEDRLHALVDDEVDARERRELESAIAHDPEATRELAWIRATKRAIQDHSEPVRCEDEWKRCVGRLNEIDRARRTESFVTRYAWVMCCALFALIVGAGLLHRSDSRQRLGARDIADITGGLAPVRLPAQLKGYLEKVLGEKPSLPTDMRVVGGSEGFYNGHRVTQLNLADGRGPLTLLVIEGPLLIEGTTPMDEKYFAGQIGRLNFTAWENGRFVYLLSGERSHEELRAIASAAQRGRRVSLNYLPTGGTSSQRVRLMIP